MRRFLPALGALLLLAAPAAAQARAIAVTVDDLPFTPAELTVAEQERGTERLLDAFRRHGVPAIGFVNEGRLYDSAGALDRRRVGLLTRWLEAGLELGNHTRTHPDLHRVTLAEFTADFLAGEQVTRRLLAARQASPRFFRHPFLHTGRSLAVRDSLDSFLSAHGYRVAPVTVDNYDYQFARAYHLAEARGDSAGAARVVGTYLDYMDSVVGFWEGQSRAIVGREIPQVLLLHASALNARAFPALAERLTGRGYRFVSLAEALADSAYRLPDRYAGPAGISWLHRWAITRGTPPSVFRGEPEVPAWVEQAAQAGP